MIGVRFHRAASDEAREAREWYEARSPGLDGVFATALEQAIEGIRQYPESRPPDPAGVRTAILHRFPYGIVYLYEEGRIDVVAVMHLHRKPGYWRDRLRAWE